jgi:hypothetical protein
MGFCQWGASKAREILGVRAAVLMGKHLSYTEEMEGGLGGEVR